MSNLSGRVRRLEKANPLTWEDVKPDIIQLLRDGKIDAADVRAAYPIECEEMIAAAQGET